MPARVIRIDGDVAWIDQDGREQPLSLLGVDGVAAGDYVYHIAGLALDRLEPDEAQIVLAALNELDSLLEVDNLGNLWESKVKE